MLNELVYSFDLPCGIDALKHFAAVLDRPLKLLPLGVATLSPDLNQFQRQRNLMSERKGFERSGFISVRFSDSEFDLLRPFPTQNYQ